MEPSDKDDGPAPDAVAILDAVIDQVAEEEAENGAPTDQDVHWSRGVQRGIQSRVAALRRQFIQVQPIDPPAVPMGSDMSTLDREGLLAWLQALHQGNGTHQDLAILKGPTEDRRWDAMRSTHRRENRCL